MVLCPPGQALQGINANGTPLCVEVGDASTLTTIEAVVASVEPQSSITIGGDDRALVSYHDALNGHLKVAYCPDKACAAPVISTVDTDGWVGEFNSITTGDDGFGLIAYYDSLNDDLKVAHCEDAACTSATITRLDTAGDAGRFASITIGSDGLGLISYHHTAAGLRVAHCNDLKCAAAALSTADQSGPPSQVTGLYTSIMVGADGRGLISYRTAFGDLRVAHCSDVVCTAAQVVTHESLPSQLPEPTAIARAGNGFGLIGYYSSGHLRVFNCGNAACSGGSGATLATNPFPGGLGPAKKVSVTRASDGRGLISFFSPGHTLTVAHCNAPLCLGATLVSLEFGGQGSSIIRGADGFGIISYYLSGALKVAHCGDACTP